MHKRGRKDANHDAVVKALEARGAEVQSLASIGGGVADLLVSTPYDSWIYENRQTLYLLEVKNGAFSPSRRELTPDQIAWHKRFPVTIVNSPEEAVRAVFGD
jgi:hypothetical protein